MVKICEDVALLGDLMWFSWVKKCWKVKLKSFFWLQQAATCWFHDRLWAIWCQNVLFRSFPCGGWKLRALNDVQVWMSQSCNVMISSIALHLALMPRHSETEAQIRTGRMGWPGCISPEISKEKQFWASQKVAPSFHFLVLQRMSKVQCVGTNEGKGKTPSHGSPWAEGPSILLHSSCKHLCTVPAHLFRNMQLAECENQWSLQKPVYRLASQKTQHHNCGEAGLENTASSKSSNHVRIIPGFSRTKNTSPLSFSGAHYFSHPSCSIISPTSPETPKTSKGCPSKTLSLWHLQALPSSAPPALFFSMRSAPGLRVFPRFWRHPVRWDSDRIAPNEKRFLASDIGKYKWCKCLKVIVCLNSMLWAGVSSMSLAIGKLVYVRNSA